MRRGHRTLLPIPSSAPNLSWGGQGGAGRVAAASSGVRARRGGVRGGRASGGGGAGVPGPINLHQAAAGGPLGANGKMEGPVGRAGRASFVLLPAPLAAAPRPDPPPPRAPFPLRTLAGDLGGGDGGPGAAGSGGPGALPRPGLERRRRRGSKAGGGGGQRTGEVSAGVGVPGGAGGGSWSWRGPEGVLGLRSGARAGGTAGTGAHRSLQRAVQGGDGDGGLGAHLRRVEIGAGGARECGSGRRPPETPARPPPARRRRSRTRAPRASSLISRPIFLPLLSVRARPPAARGPAALRFPREPRHRLQPRGRSPALPGPARTAPLPPRPGHGDLGVAPPDSGHPLFLSLGAMQEEMGPRDWYPRFPKPEDQAFENPASVSPLREPPSSTSPK